MFYVITNYFHPPTLPTNYKLKKQFLNSYMIQDYGNISTLM